MSEALSLPFSSLPHRDMCVRPPSRNNPLYPLPPNYWDYNASDRWWWRVNACCIQETPDDMVIAYAFFMYYYLWPDDTGYFENARRSPAVHFQIVHDIAAYKINAFAGPRYLCKSSIVRVLAMLLSITRRGYRIGFGGSTQAKTRESLAFVKEQLEGNERLVSDFGTVKPLRGARPWSNDLLYLSGDFRSKITGLWLKGASRGGRFDWIVWDDPEKDPDAEDIIPDNTKKLEEATHKRYLPMIEIAPSDIRIPHIGRRGSGFTIVGTIIREDMFLARGVGAAAGTTYDYWNRWRFRQVNSSGDFIWVDRWGPDSTELMREVMGHDAFDSEQNASPGETAAGRLYLDPVLHGYKVTVLDEEYASSPLTSASKVSWGYSNPTRSGEREVLYDTTSCSELFQSLDRCIIVDWADTDHITPTSDYTCLHVLGNDSDYTVWSLDLVLDKMTTDTAVDRLFALCLKWHPSRLCLESSSGFGHLCDAVFVRLKDKLLNTMGWLPAPVKLAPNTRSESKGARIDRLKWRFDNENIRFPINNLDKWPMQELRHQINNFTIKLDRLKHDDAIDTLGYIPYVFKGMGGSSPSRWAQPNLGVVEQIESGKIYTDDGHSLLECINYCDLSPKAAEVVDSYFEKKGKRNGTRRNTIIRKRIKRPI